MSNPYSNREREEHFATVQADLETRRRRHRRAVLALEIVKILGVIILAGYAAFMLGRGLALLIM